MLKLVIQEVELYDELNNEFIKTKRQTLQLEHSLVALSRWESKWKKSFIGNEKITNEEFMDYVRCMTITQNVNPNVYRAITEELKNEIKRYMNDPMSATTIANVRKASGFKETITSELIYYWMVSFRIPFECQKWHLNRLLTLIQICGEKNTPPKERARQSHRDILNRNRLLNEQRRAAINTRG